MLSVFVLLAFHDKNSYNDDKDRNPVIKEMCL